MQSTRRIAGSKIGESVDRWIAGDRGYAVGYSQMKGSRCQ